MLRRLRFKNTTLEELLVAGQRLRERTGISSGRGRLVRPTRRAKAASHLRDCLVSPGRSEVKSGPSWRSSHSL